MVKYTDTADVKLHYVYGELSVIEVPRKHRGDRNAIERINDYLAINEALKYCRYCFNSGDNYLMDYGKEVMTDGIKGKDLQAVLSTAVPSKSKKIQAEINGYILTTLNK